MRNELVKIKIRDNNKKESKRKANKCYYKIIN
jgi:hypothetical protein